MTPEERFYKILQKSSYIRNPQENPADSFDYFQRACFDCPWFDPSDGHEERMFETNVKNYFDQYHDEILQYAKDTPPTMDGKKEPFMDDIGLHTMDDQGFEGQVLNDGSYYRWVRDMVEYDFLGMTNAELESKWQSCASGIQMALMIAYSKDSPKEKSDKAMQEAKDYQDKQEHVQAEITRRHKDD